MCNLVVESGGFPLNPYSAHLVAFTAENSNMYNRG